MKHRLARPVFDEAELAGVASVLDSGVLTNGPQTEAFVLHPAHLAMPDEPLVGAGSVNELLRRWRRELNGPSAEGAEDGLEPTQVRVPTESAIEGEPTP